MTLQARANRNASESAKTSRAMLRARSCHQQELSSVSRTARSFFTLPLTARSSNQYRILRALLLSHLWRLIRLKARRLLRFGRLARMEWYGCGICRRGMWSSSGKVMSESRIPVSPLGPWPQRTQKTSNYLAPTTQFSYFLLQDPRICQARRENCRKSLVSPVMPPL